MSRNVPAAVVAAITLIALPSTTAAQSDAAKIAEAESAGPVELTRDATILDFPAEPGGEMRVIREGSNGWTCLPDSPGTDNFEPMCLDAQWVKWAEAFVAGGAPDVDGVGVSYMVSSRWKASNTDPAATGPEPGNAWHSGGPHLMVIVPDPALLAHFPDTPGDRPYVMWKGTPYVHLMIPLSGATKSDHHGEEHTN